MPDRILLPLIVACALFMENLDATILSTSLPAIAQDFGESPIRLKLALTSYLLSLAVFIPASGWLADKFAARNVFRLAIITFVTGSILCALSQSIAGLVAARIVQGMGGAMMVPVGRLLILRTVEKSALVGSMAWLTVPALMGPVMGPPLGGFITTYFEWRWIFWINVPIGCLGLVLATLYIPDVRGDAGSKFDARGFLLAGGGLAAFVSASTSMGLGVMPMSANIALLAAGLAMLIAYYTHFKRAENPILDLGLFRIATFRWAVLGGSVFRLGVGATPFLLPLMLQLSFGMTPFRSGMITFVAAIGAIAMKFAAVPLLRNFGFRTLLIYNALVAGVFIAIPAIFTATTPMAVMLALLLAGGFVRSLQFTAVNTLAFADIPRELMSRATAATSVIQQLALSFGISIGAMALEVASRGSPGSVTADAFAPAFILVGTLSALSFVLLLALPANAGQEVSGHNLRPDAVTAARERG